MSKKNLNTERILKSQTKVNKQPKTKRKKKKFRAKKTKKKQTLSESFSNLDLDGPLLRKRSFNEHLESESLQHPKHGYFGLYRKGIKLMREDSRFLGEFLHLLTNREEEELLQTIREPFVNSNLKNELRDLDSFFNEQPSGIDIFFYRLTFVHDHFKGMLEKSAVPGFKQEHSQTLGKLEITLNLLKKNAVGGGNPFKK